MGELRDRNARPRLVPYFVEQKSFSENPFVLVDVGARKGFEPHWQIFESQIKKIGFEPHPESYWECNNLKKDKCGVYYPFALGRKSGGEKLYLTEYPAASSLLKPEVKMVERMGMKQHFVIKSSIDIDVIDLDTFCREYEVEYVDFLKLDAEGIELEILLGGEKTLLHHVLGVSVEIGILDYRVGQAQFGEIDQLMRSLGFYLYDIDLSRVENRSPMNPHANKENINRLRVCQALYLRDLVRDIESDEEFDARLTAINIKKMAAIFDLFGLCNCAEELVRKAGAANYLDERAVIKYCDLLNPHTFNILEHLRRLVRP